MSLNTLITWWGTNGVALVTAAIALVLGAQAIATTLQKIVDLFPNHAVADTYFGKFIRGCESVAGFLTGLAPRPAKSFSVKKEIVVTTTPSGTGKIAILLLVSAAVSSLSACSALSTNIQWDTPVFYAGPLAAPLEEVTGKGSAPAVAAGFQQTVGFGQFGFAGHEWDVVDVGAVEAGGAVVSGSSPAGMLQLGGKIGTMDGIIGVAVLADVEDANGNGLLQGGRVGPIIGGVFDVQALITYFGGVGTESKLKGKLGLPRGGL